MTVLVITIHDNKFKDNYRNFVYKSTGVLKREISKDINQYITEVYDDKITENDEKEINKTINSLSNSGNFGKCYKVKNYGFEITCRKEVIK